jgi:hypothetical protein
MNKNETCRSRWPQAIYVFIVGMGIGWLSGLSASPVIAGVLTSILGIAGGVVAGLKSIAKDGAAVGGNKAAKTQIDALPAALLVLGIALAAPLGIMSRTYHVFEPPEVRQAVLDQVAQTGKVSGQDRGVLFSASASECAQLMALTGIPNEAAFRDELANSDLPWAVKLEAGIKDTNALKKAVRSLCTKE